MEQEQWEELCHDMAVETIVMDLTEIMVPCSEGRSRAQRCLEQKEQSSLNVKYRMGQALIALEKLGYKVIK